MTRVLLGLLLWLVATAAHAQFDPVTLGGSTGSVPTLSGGNSTITGAGAGFGGGVFNVGFIIFWAAWCSTHSRHLWQALDIHHKDTMEYLADQM